MWATQRRLYVIQSNFMCLHAVRELRSYVLPRFVNNNNVSVPFHSLAFHISPSISNFRQIIPSDILVTSNMLLYPPPTLRALLPFHIIACTHTASTFLLSVTSASSITFPVTVQTLRGPFLRATLQTFLPSLWSASWQWLLTRVQCGIHTSPQKSLACLSLRSKSSKI